MRDEIGTSTRLKIQVKKVSRLFNVNIFSYQLNIFIYVVQLFTEFMALYVNFYKRQILITLLIS